MKIISKYTLIIVLVLIQGCKPKTESPQINSDETKVLPKASKAFIGEFNRFFDLFNRDSTFQKERTKFPFRVNLINSREEDHSKDKHLNLEKNEFVILDLHKFENNSNYKTWRNVSSDGQATFTLREIGTENCKIYRFKLVDKKWFMMSCTDISSSH